MKKIVIITTYFGKWPKWFPFYLKSCETNPHINWIFFTDCPAIENVPKNTQFIKFDINRFNELASIKLDMKINISNPYMICDLKPAYGKIYEDYIKKYDFWGYGDIDLIYGNFNNFITPEILEKYDIINSNNNYMVGHFALFKNIPKVTLLFKKGPYKEVFSQSDQYFCFDETGFTFDRSIYEKSPFAERFSMGVRKKINSIFKKKILYVLPKIKSMTHIIEEEVKNGQIKLYSKMMYSTDIGRCRINILGKFTAKKYKNWQYCWDNGKLFNPGNKNEYLYFHFQLVKRNKNFLSPEWNLIPDSFYITPKGFTESIK